MRPQTADYEPRLQNCSNRNIFTVYIPKISNMHRRSFLWASGIVMTAGSKWGFFTGGEYQKVLPKVLILGDSISIGYTPFVEEMLQNLAEVKRPMQDADKAENCEGTTKAVKEIDRWLGEEKWDVIHFNFGLHDIKHVNPDTGENSMNPKDPHQASLKQYRKNLTQIVEKLKATGAHLIFATTTPYPSPVDGPLRMPGQAQKYNEAALKIMDKNDIQINDLYTFVKPQMEALMIKKNVHFTDEGSKALAGEVGKVIKEIVLRNP